MDHQPSATSSPEYSLQHDLQEQLPDELSPPNGQLLQQLQDQQLDQQPVQQMQKIIQQHDAVAVSTELWPSSDALYKYLPTELEELKKSLLQQQAQLREKELELQQRDRLQQEQHRALEYRRSVMNMRKTSARPSSSSPSPSSPSTSATAYPREYQNIRPSFLIFLLAHVWDGIKCVWQYLTCNSSSLSSTPKRNHPRTSSISHSLRRRRSHPQDTTIHTIARNNPFMDITIVDIIKHGIIVSLFFFYLQKYSSFITQFMSVRPSTSGASQSIYQQHQQFVRRSGEPIPRHPRVHDGVTHAFPPLMDEKGGGGAGGGDGGSFGNFFEYGFDQEQPWLNSQTNDNDNNDKFPKPVTPWNSKPPKPISLQVFKDKTKKSKNSTRTKEYPLFVQHRHECLSKIRKKQEQVFGELFFDYMPVETKRKSPKRNETKSKRQSTTPRANTNTTRQLKEDSYNATTRTTATNTTIINPTNSTTSTANTNTTIYSVTSPPKITTRVIVKDLLIVDPSYHANVGDHMLTLGELQFAHGFLSEAKQFKQRNINNKEERNKLLREERFEFPPAQCHYVQSNKFYPDCDLVIQGHVKTNAVDKMDLEQRPKYAMWHAGGNWGDLWRSAQDVRIPSFEILLSNNYTVIGMPQSLYYKKKELEKMDVTWLKSKVAIGLGFFTSPSQNQPINHDTYKDDESQDYSSDITWRDNFNRGNHYYNNPIQKDANTTALDTPEGLALAHKRVILTWRERESFEAARELYPFVRNVMAPDIAFQLGPYEPIRPKGNTAMTTADMNQKENHDPLESSNPSDEDDNDRPLPVDIVVFLRNDIESKYSLQRNTNYVESVLSTAMNTTRKISTPPTFILVDWPDRLSMFHDDDYFFTNTSIELLSLGKIVICDRLHATILSYLTGLPFIYIDQVSGKISKTLGVAISDNCGSNHEMKAFYAKALTLEDALTKAVDWLDRYDL